MSTIVRRLPDDVDAYELYHHGIKGQRWGVRRYQNEDGSLTPAGQKRYEKGIQNLIDRRTTYNNMYKATNNLSEGYRTGKIKPNEIAETNYEGPDGKEYLVRVLDKENASRAKDIAKELLADTDYLLKNVTVDEVLKLGEHKEKIERAKKLEKVYSGVMMTGAVGGAALSVVNLPATVAVASLVGIFGGNVGRVSSRQKLSEEYKRESNTLDKISERISEHTPRTYKPMSDKEYEKYLKEHNKRIGK